MRTKKTTYTVRAEYTPLYFPPGRFPRSFETKKKAVEFAKESISNGATGVYVKSPNGTEQKIDEE